MLCDPWLHGKAFNNGWALLSTAAEVRWPRIDYVWISHQHPDHLNFPTLKSIDTQQRRRLKMLYQKHASARIARVLAGMGFENVTELKLNTWIPLRDGLDVMCGSVGMMDSWIGIRAEGVTILNLNDCIMSRSHLVHVLKLVGRPKVLLTQFSFANWIGNHADEADAVETKLKDVRFRIEYLQPEVTIPFASFVYFCNRENSWMNSFAVTPERLANMKLPGVHFLYPGDEWDSSIGRFNSAEAVEKYMADIQRIKIDPTPPTVDVKVIEEAANRTLRMLRGRFGSFLIGRIKPFKIHIHDLDKILIVNPAKACEVLSAKEDSPQNAKLVMCSQMAWYAFAYPWGWDAMEVSGMYLHRGWREPFPLAFYMNALGTDFLDLRNHETWGRLMQFMWAKRHEIKSRVLDRFNGRPG